MGGSETIYAPTTARLWVWQELDGSFDHGRADGNFGVDEVPEGSARHGRQAADGHRRGQFLVDGCGRKAVQAHGSGRGTIDEGYHGVSQTQNCAYFELSNAILKSFMPKFAVIFCKNTV